MISTRKSVIFIVGAMLALAFPQFSHGSEAQTPPQAAAAWKTVVKDGVHWLLTPEGRYFYSKGVNIVTSGKENEKSLNKQSYYWGNFFPSIDNWRRDTGEQLSQWGFNTRGGWSDPSPALNLGLTVDLELGRNSKFHWFDPFDPAMEEETVRWAQQLTAPYRNDPRLIGYYSDNEVGWWNSPLFSWYLKAEWSNHTKQALWHLLYARYGGEWSRLLQDWVPEGNLSSFEDLKSAGAVIKLRPGGRGIHAVDEFLRLCAGRYYQLMSHAIKTAHPGALYLGDRLPLYYHQDAILAMGDYVNVISTNYNVDVPDGWVAPYYFDGLRRLNPKPVLVTEFFFAAEENRSGNKNETARNDYPKHGHLMTVETQAERAWGAANAIQNFARFPNVVGAHWFQYCDEPLGGREDGEDYNMGLIDNANRPYKDVVDVFKCLNPLLDACHAQSATISSLRVEGLRVSPEDKPAANAAAPGDGKLGPTAAPVAAKPDDRPSTDGAVAIEQASLPIDVRDQSLLDWDKEKTRLKDFQTPKPYVPFGDVHLSWDQRGIYLASIANTYVNPSFMTYKGDFPLQETFQIHFVVEDRGAIDHFAIYLVPKPDKESPDGFETEAQLYRLVEGRPPERIPGEGRVQKLKKSLPHVAVEAFFPAEWMGLERLQPGARLRVNVLLQSYYGEFAMIWSGPPALETLSSPKSLRTIVLEGPGGKGGPSRRNDTEQACAK